MVSRSHPYSKHEVRYLEENPWVRTAAGIRLPLKSALGKTQIDFFDPALVKLIPPTNESIPGLSPAVSFEQWQAIRDAAIAGELEPAKINQDASFEPLRKEHCLDLTASKNASAEELGRAAIRGGKLAVLMLAAGTGGRLFGYAVPEHRRIKVLAPINFQGRQASPLELRMRHFFWAQDHFSGKITLDINTTGQNGAAILEALETILSPHQVSQVTIWPKFGLPRWVPTVNQVAGSKQFVSAMAKNGITERTALFAAAEQDVEASGEPGDIFFNDTGEISTKPLGQLMTLTTAAINGTLARWLSSGIEVLMINNGEDIGGTINPAFIGTFLQTGGDVLYVVVDASAGGGGPVIKDGKAILMEKEAVPDSVKSDMSLKNTNLMFLRAATLPRILCGLSVEEFLAASPRDILNSLGSHFYRRMFPIPEAKPVLVNPSGGTRFAGQAAWVLGHLSHATNATFAWAPADECFVELKEPDDVARVKAWAEANYSGKLI